MPAGLYSVALVSPAGVLEFYNTTTHATAMVIGNPISAEAGVHPAQVTFTTLNGKYALSEVYLPSGARFRVPVRSAGH